MNKVLLACALMVSAPAFAQTSFVLPNGAQALQTRCLNPTSCYSTARASCGGGTYQVINSESRTYGFLTWNTMQYVCGRSDGRLATFPHRGPYFRQWNCDSYEGVYGWSNTSCGGNF